MTSLQARLARLESPASVSSRLVHQLVPLRIAAGTVDGAIAAWEAQHGRPLELSGNQVLRVEFGAMEAHTAEMIRALEIS